MKKGKSNKYPKPNWDKIDVKDFAIKLLGKMLPKGKLEDIIEIIQEWHNNEAAILSLSTLHTTVTIDNRVKKIDLKSFEKSFKRFWKEAGKTGVINLPNFRRAFCEMKKAYYLDRVSYLYRPSTYQLKVANKISDGKQSVLRLKPRMGKGQPTTAERDFNICALIDIIKTRLKLSSLTEAIDTAYPLLRLIGCNFTTKNVERIVTKPPNSIIIEPPNPELVREKLKILTA